MDFATFDEQTSVMKVTLDHGKKNGTLNILMIAYNRNCHQIFLSRCLIYLFSSTKSNKAQGLVKNKLLKGNGNVIIKNKRYNWELLKQKLNGLRKVFYKENELAGEVNM
jgi:hypothetical protein